MDKLKEIRKKIDSVDKKLITLFSARMELSAEIAEVKRDNNIPVYDQKRENDLIENLKNKITEKYQYSIPPLYSTILTLSREEQNKKLSDENESFLENEKPEKIKELKIAYQGLEGSFSEEALLKLFPDAKKISYPTFEDVFIAVRDEEVSYGIVPIENWETGAIEETYDLLRRYGNFIVDKTWIRVSHALIGCIDAKLKDIKIVYSHPEALKQCHRFLQANEFEEIALKNTAIAAEKVAVEKNKEQAAIASERAAKKYGLNIIKKDIADNKKNKTAFVVLSKKSFYDKNSNIISLIFSIKDKPGALLAILMIFSSFGINLTRLVSKPSLEFSTYSFFCDISGNIEDVKIKNAFSLIESEAEYFEVLGNYEEN